MADDEGTMETTQEETETSEREDRQPPPDSDEAKRAMEDRILAKAERQKQEMAEYEEMRRAEREKEAAEIAALKEKRIQRAKERGEEEKKWAELRAQEDARQKAEQEERRRKKQEEEGRKKEDRERKKKDAEERLNRPKGPNFVITKRSDAEKVGGGLDSVMSKEELQKSKEQLEEEKRAILAQRIQPLQIEGVDTKVLLEKARELHEHMRRLEGDKYDLEQRFKRQQYDMIELAERARQLSKGKGKRGVAAVPVDESFDRLADKFTGAPPKIQLCSKYERHTDHRTYVERKDLFEELAKEPPPPEIKHVGSGKSGSEAEGGEPAAVQAAE